MTATYLADKSALVRLPDPAVQARLRPLLEEGLVATCAVVDLEMLYSARNVEEYEAIREERSALDDVPITPQIMSLAIDMQQAMVAVGTHRVPTVDLIIAAAAASAELTVLHYDADFGRIGEATGMQHDWVVPRGSV